MPWTFKFIVAPLMDRHTYLPMGRKRPWVILAQAGLMTSLAVMACVPDMLHNLSLFMGATFLVSTFGAMQDAATDGMAIGDKWTRGVGQVMAALVIAKATDLYGDIPYSHAFDIVKYPTPVFDKQADVYASLQKVLDDGIRYLSVPTDLGFSGQDFIYKGNVAKWKAAAYTLKARLYLHTGDYAGATTAAGSGTGSTAGDALVPYGTSQGVDLNQNYDFFRLTCTGDAGFDGAYLPVLMQSRIGSANTKTDETPLYNHYLKVGVTTAGALDPNTDNGMFAKDAPHPIITYYENQLILAEAQARLGGTDQALAALNSVRAGLSGGYINGKIIASAGRIYDAYTIADFGASGIANPKKLTTVQTALLYDIIAQRYIFFLMQYEAFNDVRRLDLSRQGTYCG